MKENINYNKLLEVSEEIQNEEDTKQVLIMPLLNAFGYDIGFETDLRYEYYVNGKDYGKKVDIVIPEGYNSEGLVPKIFIEVKAKEKHLWNYHIQIEDYLDQVPQSILGVLTNGLDYEFFHTDTYSTFFAVYLGNFRPNWIINYYELSIFTKLLSPETSSEEIIQLATKLSLMKKLNIEISNESDSKLNKIIKMLPKEATASSVTDLALDCLDRYFTTEQIEMEFKKMNKWCS